jgi:hypothetical protein
MGSALPLRLERAGHRLDVAVHYDGISSSGLASAVLPAPIAELRPHVWYVDFSRIGSSDLQPYMDRLVSADAVVFDLRNYPRDAAPVSVLTQLLDHAEHAPWSHLAHVDGPFGLVGGSDDAGWDLEPATPRLRGRAVFLAGGNSISFADSVLGYVDEEHLGLIVGGTSAGTSGNIQAFFTPGGYYVRYTGMRVTRHDGHSRTHLLGVAPDVPAEQTVAGFRAGRDEVIEKALRAIGAD